jgi:Mn2+/Fe2+ NRAMP family transporter
MALALFNLLFVAAAVLSRPSPGQLVEALVTWTPLPTEPFQGFLLILASNIGATVTPWMLFFQQSASVDEGLTPKDIPQGRLDTPIGTSLVALAGCAALVAASTLFVHHVDSSSLLGGAGYAEALQPLIGSLGSGLFALGLIEAGAVAMLTISASTAYAVGEVLSGSAHSFNRTIRQAPLFYAANIGMAVFAGIIVLIPGMPLLAITLNANLLATILMPAALVFLLILANDRDIMGARVNSRLTNIFGALIALLVTVAGSSYAIVAFLNSLSRKQTDRSPQMQPIDRLSHGHPDDELVQALEPDQLVAATSMPLPRYQLSRAANVGLWFLRIFVLLMTALVVYTFVKALP